MATAICPICGLEGEEGAFCEICGREAGRLLAVSAPSEPEPSAPEPEPPVPEPVLDPEPTPEPKPRSASETSVPFRARAVCPSVMWRGQSSPVQIFFKAERPLYRNVTVALYNGPEERERRELGFNPFTDERKFNFNFIPRVAGVAIELTVRFEVLRDGANEPDVFTAPLVVSVKEESVRPLNISTNIDASHGGSVLQYHSDPIARLDVRDHRFERVKETEHPLTVSPFATARRLTLRAEDGSRLHVWAMGVDETVVFGRQDVCDGVLRVFDKTTGRPDNEKSRALSRKQFRLWVDRGRRLVIADGADRPSGYGTSVNGAAAGCAGVSLGVGSNLVELAPSAAGGPVLTLRVKLCLSDDGRLEGFEITRDDGCDERFLVVVGERRINLAEGFLGWDGRRFHSEAGVLVPGTDGCLGGCRLAVGSYTPSIHAREVF